MGGLSNGYFAVVTSIALQRKRTLWESRTGLALHSKGLRSRVTSLTRPMPVMLFLSFDAYNNQRATWRRMMMLLLANFPSSSPSLLPPSGLYFKVQQTCSPHLEAGTADNMPQRMMGVGQIAFLQVDTESSKHSLLSRPLKNLVEARDVAVTPSRSRRLPPPASYVVIGTKVTRVLPHPPPPPPRGALSSTSSSSSLFRFVSHPSSPPANLLPRVYYPSGQRAPF